MPAWERAAGCDGMVAGSVAAHPKDWPGGTSRCSLLAAQLARMCATGATPGSPTHSSGVCPHTVPMSVRTQFRCLPVHTLSDVCQHSCFNHAQARAMRRRARCWMPARLQRWRSQPTCPACCRWAACRCPHAPALHACCLAFFPAVLLTLPCLSAGGLPAAVPGPAPPPPPYTAACCSCPATTPARTLLNREITVICWLSLPCHEPHLLWLPSTGRHLLFAVQRLPSALCRGSRGVPARWRGNRGGAARAGGKGAPALHGHWERGAASWSACGSHASVWQTERTGHRL